VIAVEYLDDLGKASSRAGLERALAAGRGPFDRPEWWDLIVRHGGARPLFVLASGGEEAVLLPMASAGGRITGLANWYTFRWRPLASSPRLLAGLARGLRQHGWQVTLQQVPDEDGSASRLAEALRSAGWRVRLEPHDVNHVLAVGGRRYAEYLAGRPGRLRTALKRKAGKVACEVLDRFDEPAWRAYEAIYAASWKPEEGAPAMLEEFARAEGAAGRLRLGIARVDGEAVAAQMWTVEHGTAWIHKLAHREDSRALSPGTVLSAALFERVIDGDGVELIDFGTGDDGYKRDWMEDVRTRWRIDALDPRSPRAWPGLARDLARDLAARLKRR